MATVEDIKAIIVESGVVGDVDSMSSDGSLRDQGVDSLDMLNVFFLLEEKYEITIPEEDIDSLHSMDDIVGYINEKTATD